MGWGGTHPPIYPPPPFGLATIAEGSASIPVLPMHASTTVNAGKPLAVCGMHRSGTSLTASILQAAGLCMGDTLLGPGPGNPAGHFEDVDFLQLHIRALRAQGLGDEGYATNVRPELPPTLERGALDLVAARAAAAGDGAWGWKQPRTVLFLDFWARLLPAARFAFVFRNPWDVADSLFRRGDESFVLNPRLAIEVWLQYNRRIEMAVRRMRDRSVIRETSQVVEDPEGFRRDVETLLGTPLQSPVQTFRPELFHTHDPCHLSALVRAVSPEAYDLYLRLRRLARSTAPLPPPVRTRIGAAAVENELLAWSIAARRGIDYRPDLPAPDEGHWLKRLPVALQFAVQGAAAGPRRLGGAD